MENLRLLINGCSFVTDKSAFDVKCGVVEVGRISKPVLGLPRPMHLLDFSFQVLEWLSSPAQVSRS